MKAGSLLVLLAAAVLSGCTAGEPANPNLGAPKLVVDPRPDGNVTVFLHSAFGERSYDWLALRVDNESVANRSHAFSLEQDVASRGFFLEAEGGTAEQLYEMRARVDVLPDGERATVSFLDAEGKWTEPRSFSLPFGSILERREVA